MNLTIKPNSNLLILQWLPKNPEISRLKITTPEAFEIETLKKYNRIKKVPPTLTEKEIIRLIGKRLFEEDYPSRLTKSEYGDIKKPFVRLMNL